MSYNAVSFAGQRLPEGRACLPGGPFVMVSNSELWAGALALLEVDRRAELVRDYSGQVTASRGPHLPMVPSSKNALPFSFPGGSVHKECSCNDPGRSPGEGNGNPLQYSCFGNLRVRRAWQATVHRVGCYLAIKPPLQSRIIIHYLK